MDEALHLPPMKQPSDLGSGRGQEDQIVVQVISPVQAPEFTAPHHHATKPRHPEDDRYEDAKLKQEPSEEKLVDQAREGQSSPESSDSNDFVKVEKEDKIVGRDDDIAPIDDGVEVVEEKPRHAPPAQQPVDPALAAQARQRFEDLMDSASEIAQRVERDMESLLQRTERSKSSYRSVDDESPIRREGPLTLGRPVETRPLHTDPAEIRPRQEADQRIHDLRNFEPVQSANEKSLQSDVKEASSRKGLGLFSMKNWDPRALDLIYWRDPRKSGIVLASTLLLLFLFSYYNVVSVLSYLGLIILSATLGYRVYASVTATVNKTEQKNPFQPFLEKPVDLPQEHAHDHVDNVMRNIKELINHLRRLFLVESVPESIKFGLLLWALTYVGEYVTGTCLVILDVIGLFTLPKIYELYQPQIDNYYNMAEQKVRPVLDTAKTHLDKVPYLNNKKPAAKQE